MGVPRESTNRCSVLNSRYVHSGLDDYLRASITSCGLSPQRTGGLKATLLSRSPATCLRACRRGDLRLNCPIRPNGVRRGWFAWGRFRQSLQDWTFGGAETLGIHLRWLPRARIEIPFRDCPRVPAPRSANPRRSNVSPRSKLTSPPPPAASFQIGPTAHALPISPPSTSTGKPLIEATPGDPIIKRSRTEGPAQGLMTRTQARH